VFVARHESLAIFKVVKVLLPEYSQNKHVRARFLREAEAVAGMDHPCVITVDNFGALPSGELFLMMPLLSGHPLDAYLRAASKLGAHHALQIAAQVASALQHAHARGIVHRDLKPGNIFVERRSGRDVVKLLDFGIAKDANVAVGARTQAGISLGTPSYMACEQYDDASAVTAAADVFALAIVIVEMLTGTLPWGLGLDNVLYFRQKSEAPTFGPEVPRAWRPILSSALAPDPARRPPSARALVVELAAALDARPPIWPAGLQVVETSAPDLIQRPAAVDATVRSSGNLQRSALSAASAALVAAPSRSRPRRTRVLALVLLGVLVAALAAVLVAYATGAVGHRKVVGETSRVTAAMEVPA
jgi:serine/threonine protein kinase